MCNVYFAGERTAVFSAGEKSRLFLSSRTTSDMSNMYHGKYLILNLNVLNITHNSSTGSTPYLLYSKS